MTASRPFCVPPGTAVTSRWSSRAMSPTRRQSPGAWRCCGRPSATDMSESDYIDGIFNYCDRWCERCPFTARCRTFAMEQEFERAEQEGRDPEDIDWDSFWTRVGLSFDNTPPEWLGEFDDDDRPEFDL